MSIKVKIYDKFIGGGERILVQSMSTCKISNLTKAILEADRLKQNGCDILRFSVLDQEDAQSFCKLKSKVDIPLVADIHFDYKLAIDSIKGGADKIRINPGNIGGEQNLKSLATELKASRVPIRVGSNTGSIEREFLERYGKTEVALAESALKNVALLEKYGVNNIVISVKASSVPLMVKAYQYIAKKTDYPLHLGVTEAGTMFNGVIKNSIGIGSLLLSGIGDTLRVSLSCDPVEEVKAGKTILSALGIKKDCPEIIACPTCGRCEWDCMGFAKKVEDYLANVNKPIKVAVMGCVVNGPGEAKDADIGVAGAKDGCAIFKNGKVIKTVKKEELDQHFFREIDRCLNG